MEKHELIICIVNNGFTDLVMDAARKEGARGGTIFHGRGTGNPDMEKFFGFSISPEKEIIIILVEVILILIIVTKIFHEVFEVVKGWQLAHPQEQYLPFI